MMNVLIVEDNAGKTSNIRRIIEDSPVQANIDIVADINGAMRILNKKNVDLLILDLFIPRTYGDTPLKDGGSILLNDIQRAKRVHYPDYVISISEYKEGIEAFNSGNGGIHKSIIYDSTTTDWENELKNVISVAEQALKNSGTERFYEYDVAIVCAMREELALVENFLDDVEDIRLDYDDQIYKKGYVVTPSRKISVVIAHAPQKGMVAASTLTSALIYQFTPRYIFMTGIAGGTKKEKDTDRRNGQRSEKEIPGDIIVASCSWDYQAGKEIKKEDAAYHLNSINQVAVDTSLIASCTRIAEDEQFLKEIHDSFNGGSKPIDVPKVHIGSMVSGASVVGNPKIVDEILLNQDRDVLGLDMETYGVYYAANWAIKPRPLFLSIKSISDFADSDKNDDYHVYASYTSASITEKLIKSFLTFDD